jgi:hypothetical protein
MHNAVRRRDVLAWAPGGLALGGDPPPMKWSGLMYGF